MGGWERPDIIAGMHRPAALLAALVLVLSGCGSATKDEPSSAATGAPADHAGAGEQRALLTKAVARLRAAGSGTYVAEVSADGVSQPLAHETGSYQLAPVAAQLERTLLGIDETSAKPRVQVVRVRATPDGRFFLQLKEWGSWSGCWLPMDRAALSAQTGVDIGAQGALPTVIGALARAKVVGSGGGLDGPHLAVDAYTALQVLGVSAAAISADRAALRRTSVPLLLDVTADGDPSGVAVEGTQVADVLATAGLDLPAKVDRYVAAAHARAQLDDLGAPARVAAPPRALQLARDASPKSTCPANS